MSSFVARDTRLVAIDRLGLDITRRETVFAIIADVRPDIVVNTAAYTAVDRAESEPDAAWAANCAGPGNIAAACRKSGIPLIHISTDYVFDGTKSGAYREDDPVNPLGVYGASKEAGERAVRAALREHIILRTAWVYSAHGHNFVKTMLRLARERPVLRVVADQTGSPTSAADIAGAITLIAQCVSKRQCGLGNLPFRRRRRRNLARLRGGDFRFGVLLARTAATRRGHHDRRLPDPGAAAGQFGARLLAHRRGVRC